MTSLISIITTTYNREKYLSASIESILAQTYPNFELIIWDDGSTDSSLTIAGKYAQQDARIQVIAAPTKAEELLSKPLIHCAKEHT
jgi:glycosyltransferase involved in cell wall biosynthesis